MMNFSFNTDTFAKDWWLIALRKPKLLAWSKVVLKPMKTMVAEFNTFVTEKRDEYKYNGRVISLRNLLVSKFGAGITIELQEPKTNPYLLDETGYLFNHLLGDTGNTDNPLLDVSGSADVENADFIVKVPVGLGADLNEVRGLVKKYAIPTILKVEEI